MNLFADIARRLALAKKRRKLRAVKEWVRTLEDQVISGQLSLKHFRAKVDQIEAEIAMLESPDDIVRRTGAGA